VIDSADHAILIDALDAEAGAEHGQLVIHIRLAGLETLHGGGAASGRAVGDENECILTRDEVLNVQ